MDKVTMFLAFLVFFAFSNIQIVISLKCELLGPPVDKSSGPEMGIIFVPGAKIEGHAYEPLTKALQAEFPGRLWVGLTEDWWATMPNPIQIGHAIDACFEEAG